MRLNTRISSLENTRTAFFSFVSKLLQFFVYHISLSEDEALSSDTFWDGHDDPAPSPVNSRRHPLAGYPRLSDRIDVGGLPAIFTIPDLFFQVPQSCQVINSPLDGTG